MGIYYWDIAGGVMLIIVLIKVIAEGISWNRKHKGKYWEWRVGYGTEYYNHSTWTVVNMTVSK